MADVEKLLTDAGASWDERASAAYELWVGSAPETMKDMVVNWTLSNLSSGRSSPNDHVLWECLSKMVQEPCKNVHLAQLNFELLQRLIAQLKEGMKGELRPETQYALLTVLSDGLEEHRLITIDNILKPTLLLDLLQSLVLLGCSSSQHRDKAASLVQPCVTAAERCLRKYLNASQVLKCVVSSLMTPKEGKCCLTLEEEMSSALKQTFDTFIFSVTFDKDLLPLYEMFFKVKESKEKLKIKAPKDIDDMFAAFRDLWKQDSKAMGKFIVEFYRRFCVADKRVEVASSCLRQFLDVIGLKKGTEASDEALGCCCDLLRCSLDLNVALRDRPESPWLQDLWSLWCSLKSRSSSWYLGLELLLHIKWELGGKKPDTFLPLLFLEEGSPSDEGGRDSLLCSVTEGFARRRQLPLLVQTFITCVPTARVLLDSSRTQDALERAFSDVPEPILLKMWTSLQNALMGALKDKEDEAAGLAAALLTSLLPRLPLASLTTTAVVLKQTSEKARELLATILLPCSKRAKGLPWVRGLDEAWSGVTCMLARVARYRDMALPLLPARESVEKWVQALDSAKSGQGVQAVQVCRRMCLLDRLVVEEESKETLASVATDICLRLAKLQLSASESTDEADVTGAWRAAGTRLECLAVYASSQHWRSLVDTVVAGGPSLLEVCLPRHCLALTRPVVVKALLARVLHAAAELLRPKTSSSEKKKRRVSEGGTGAAGLLERLSEGGGDAEETRDALRHILTSEPPALKPNCRQRLEELVKVLERVPMVGVGREEVVRYCACVVTAVWCGISSSALATLLTRVSSAVFYAAPWTPLVQLLDRLLEKEEEEKGASQHVILSLDLCLKAALTRPLPEELDQWVLQLQEGLSGDGDLSRPHVQRCHRLAAAYSKVLRQKYVRPVMEQYLSSLAPRVLALLTPACRALPARVSPRFTPFLKCIGALGLVGERLSSKEDFKTIVVEHADRILDVLFATVRGRTQGDGRDRQDEQQQQQEECVTAALECVGTWLPLWSARQTSSPEALDILRPLLEARHQAEDYQKSLERAVMVTLTCHTPDQLNSLATNMLSSLRRACEREEGAGESVALLRSVRLLAAAGVDAASATVIKSFTAKLTEGLSLYVSCMGVAASGSASVVAALDAATAIVEKHPSGSLVAPGLLCLQSAMALLPKPESPVSATVLQHMGALVLAQCRLLNALLIHVTISCSHTSAEVAHVVSRLVRATVCVSRAAREEDVGALVPAAQRLQRLLVLLAVQKNYYHLRAPHVVAAYISAVQMGSPPGVVKEPLLSGIMSLLKSIEPPVLRILHAQMQPSLRPLLQTLISDLARMKEATV